MVRLPCKVSILGTEYEIKKVAYESDLFLRKNSVDGYCSGTMKQIVICDMRTWPNMENEEPEAYDRIEAHILRHELIHAFLNESGLQESAGVPKAAWSQNEEMVDWIAIQFQKIEKVMVDLDCLK